MERILNLLELKESRQKDFADAAWKHEQLFAPNGRDPETGELLEAAVYRDATVILGNPPPDYVRQCRGLRLLQTKSAGTEQYAGLLPTGTELLSAYGAYGHSVSEHLLALLLALMKRLPAYRDRQNGAVWQDLGQVKTLLGARVLCVGTGDLGSSFARLCKRMGAETRGVRRNAEKPAEGIDSMYPLSRLDELLPWADVVVLTLPHNRDSQHLMDRRRLLLMKGDGILLNGGRGTAVDCAALAELKPAEKEKLRQVLVDMKLI